MLLIELSVLSSAHHIAHTPKDSSALASSWVPRQVVRTWKSETECKSYAKDKENHHIVTPNRAKVRCIDLAVRRGVGPGVYRNFFFSFSQVGTVGLVIWSIYLICGFRSHGNVFSRSLLSTKFDRLKVSPLIDFESPVCHTGQISYIRISAACDVSINPLPNSRS